MKYVEEKSFIFYCPECRQKMRVPVEMSKTYHPCPSCGITCFLQPAKKNKKITLSQSAGNVKRRCSILRKCTFNVLTAPTAEHIIAGMIRIHGDFLPGMNSTLFCSSERLSLWRSSFSRSLSCFFSFFRSLLFLPGGETNPCN